MATDDVGGTRARVSPAALTHGNNNNNETSLKRKKKKKSSMARSNPVENLLPLLVGSIINYLQLWYRSSPMGTSRLQSTPASYEQWRQRRLIQLTGRTHHRFFRAVPLSVAWKVQVRTWKRCISAGNRTQYLQHPRQPHCLCGHSW